MVPDEVVAKVQGHLPWAFMTYYAEGTVAAMELGDPTTETLTDDVWTKAAARTTGQTDDQLMALVAMAYGQLSPRGWAMWQLREWDYGGCSPLGDGDTLHLRLLKLTDTLKGSVAVADVVSTIRYQVMSDVLQPQGPGEFPYCVSREDDGGTGKLLAEAGQILAEVTLSDAERAMLQARVDARFPETSP